MITVPDDLSITIDDIRKSGHCTAGARRWFEGCGLSFRDFLQNGLPAKDLMATGDALAQQVVERTVARRNTYG